MTIVLDNLTIRVAASDETLIRGVSRTLPSGGIVTLSGPSGSGKTALAHALLGWVRNGLHVTGSVNVAGTDPFTLTPKELRRFRSRTVGYVDQDPGSALDPHQRISSILGELEVHPGSGVRWARALGLPVDAAFLRRRIGQISGGQARRVAMARHAAAEPKVLVLDEPSAGLDAAARTELVTELRSLTKRLDGVVVIVTHDRTLVTELGPKTRLRIDNGLVVPDTTAADTLPAAPPVTSTNPVLQIRNLTVVRAGSQPLCRSLSLTVAEHTGIALVGPSGAGKTSIVHAVLGLLPPAEGTVTVDGEVLPANLRHRTPRQRRLFGHVAQDSSLSLDPRRPVGEAIIRSLVLSDPTRGAQAHASALRGIASDVGLDESLLSRRPAQLSGGQRQRVCVARALALAPRVLICDEATASLDEATRGHLLDSLVRMRDTHPMALVVITHEDEVAHTLCIEKIAVGNASAPPPPCDVTDLNPVLGQP